MTEAKEVVHHAMNWVDYTIIGIVVFSALISFFRGLIKEAISLGFWLVGLIVALKFASPVHDYLQQWIASPILRYLIAFIGLFLIVFIIGVLANMLIQAMVKAAGLSFTDRMLGIFFGIARGMAIVIVVLLFVNAGTLADSKAIQTSQLAPHFMPAVKWLQRYLPDGMKAVSTWVQPLRQVKSPQEMFIQQ